MSRSRVIFAIGGVIASLCIAAVCQGYYPCGPVCCETCAAKPSGVKLAPVNELLDKLEALKAKREAIEKEEQAPRAALLEQLAAQHERLAKLGIVPAAPSSPVPPSTAVPATYYEPMTTYRENSYYEPVTSYITTRVFDKQTNSFKNETSAVTKYVLRQVKVPVTTYQQRSVETPSAPTGCQPACQPLPPPTAPEPTANPAPPSLQLTPR